MVRRLVIASLVLLAGLLAAGAASPQIIPVGCMNCVVPVYLDIYGARNGAPDPLALGTQNVVIVRDLGNYPVAGKQVTISFCPDVKIVSPIPGHPELVVHCGSPTTVTGYTDAQGRIQFPLVGASINSNGVAAGAGTNCATICIGADCMVLTAQSTVAVFDENGAVGTPGLEGGDFAGWLGDFGKRGVIGYKGRSDYSHNGLVEGGDLAVMLRVFGAGNSREGGGTLCP